MRIVAALSVVLSLLLPVILLANPKNKIASQDKLIVINYAIADLPVRRTNLKDAPKFAPELLTAYLRSTIDPNSWNAGAEVRPFGRNASLVISQTKANHEKIADAIHTLRVSDAREVEEVRK